MSLHSRICSSTSLTIYLIKRERRWRTNTFFEEGIILGLSVADLISSRGMFLQPYLTSNLLLSSVPSTAARELALSLGFLAPSSFMYSSPLVIYFSTVVRRDRIVDVKPARSWELLIHAVIWVGGLVLATSGSISNPSGAAVAADSYALSTMHSSTSTSDACSTADEKHFCCCGIVRSHSFDFPRVRRRHTTRR